MKRFLILIPVLVLFLSGCSPKLSPLYRDYAVNPVEEGTSNGESIFERMEKGLESAGWTPIEGVTPNVLATEMRRFREWGLYSVEVELEVAPIGGDYVRLLIHPYRIYFTGAKSKVPYLRGSLARSVLKDLHAAFDEQGLTFIGTAQSRDREALRRIQ